MFNINELTDKSILLLSCLFIYLLQPALDVHVVPILIIIILVCLLSCFENQLIRTVLFILYAMVAFYTPPIVFFMPVILYELMERENQFFFLLIIIPMFLCYDEIGMMIFGSIIVLCILGLWCKHRTILCNKLKENNNKLGDNTREMSEQLKIQNKVLLNKMDVDINLATLKERNRIAREIHDNVGHQLSSAILQIGALMTIDKDSKIHDTLISINYTLSEAMNSIRNSVHDLHDQSIDLHMQIEGLLKKFSFCQVNFDDELKTQPNKNVKMAFIAIVKEALSNIVKHSNATQTTILLREHPAFYQFIIKDNGSDTISSNGNGLGLLNMTERIEGIKGNINFHKENGFEIFITVPKEESF
ncbi:MAG: sensor histidine kinase [Eubacteriales bacterium]